MFTPGYLSAAGAALLNEMARQYQANGFRIGVTSWPLTVSRPGRMQGTIIGIDPGAFPPGFFFAEILGSAAAYPSGGSGTDADDRAYSWVERVQDVAGVWKDGPRFGEFNAYAAESETGFPGEVAAGTMVMMRASSSVAGTWEFLPAASGSGGGTALATQSATLSSGSRVSFTSTPTTVLSLTVTQAGQYLISYTLTTLLEHVANSYVVAFIDGLSNGTTASNYMRTAGASVDSVSDTTIRSLAAGTVLNLRSLWAAPIGSPAATIAVALGGPNLLDPLVGSVNGGPSTLYTTSINIVKLS